MSVVWECPQEEQATEVHQSARPDDVLDTSSIRSERQAASTSVPPKEQVRSACAHAKRVNVKPANFEREIDVLFKNKRGYR
jgi:hypothetical protein